uniref:Ribosomal RNA small subunit methyltransferase NEP1 n=1 Tax=Zea mays TaxID=4577 RepID=A0A804PL46_MAIZE
MGRPYAVKGRKKKRKLEEAAAASDAAPPVEEAEELPPPEVRSGEEKSSEEDEAAAGEEEHAAADGLPILPRTVDGKRRPGAIFVLERACLEVGKVGKTMQILNSDDHANYLRKQNRNPADYRPDIIHQAVYVRTEKGVLFEIKPHVRMPRTFKRFCGLMSQLLQKLSITAVGKREKLLNVVKNPVTRYLPVGARLSFSAEKSVNLFDYVAKSNDDEPLVFVVGAMAHGKIDKEYTDDYIQICNYPLSAACCLNRICSALEQKWNIQ